MVRSASQVRTLALRGLECPQTFVRTKLAMEALAPGQRLRVIVDNPLSRVDLPRSAREHGYRVLGVEELEPGAWAITLER